MDFPQSFFKAAGNYCCYALQLFNVAKKIGLAGGFNEQSALELGITSGFIRWNEKDYADYDNFTVLNASAFVSLLTDKKYCVRRETAEYKPKKGEYVINFWAKNLADANRGIGHFDSPDYHTLQRSETIRVGKIYSTRVIYPKG